MKPLHFWALAFQDTSYLKGGRFHSLGGAINLLHRYIKWLLFQVGFGRKLFIRNPMFVYWADFEYLTPLYQENKNPRTGQNAGFDLKHLFVHLE
ncbi:hypothetical protein SDJN03_30039, partial [Cucurbita argyrosperma subsp. sororia]